MNDILERAARYGLETEYRDAFGHLQSVEPEVLARLLDSLATGGEEPTQLLPRTVVVRGQDGRLLHLAVPEGVSLRWEIWSEQRIAHGEGSSPASALEPRHLRRAAVESEVVAVGECLREILLM